MDDCYNCYSKINHSLGVFADKVPYRFKQKSYDKSVKHSITSRNVQCYPLPRPTSFLLPQFLVLNLMKCGLDVYDSNLSFENFLCYIQVLNTFLTLVLGVLMERLFQSLF